MKYYLILILLGLSISTLAQSKAELPTFKDGVYATLDEFKANAPSNPVAEIENAHLYNPMRSTFCLDKRKSELPDHVFSSWGICYKGQPYVRSAPERFETPNIFERPKLCFERLTVIGSLSRVYTQKPSGGQKLKLVEYVINLETDEWANMTVSKSKVIKWIKSDPHFADQKIKWKDIDLYITEYNRRNNIFSEN